jgi:hypothetical protein
MNYYRVRFTFAGRKKFYARVLAHDRNDARQDAIEELMRAGGEPPIKIHVTSLRAYTVQKRGVWHKTQARREQEAAKDK